MSCLSSLSSLKKWLKAKGSHIEQVIIDGRTIVHRGKALSLDEMTLHAEFLAQVRSRLGSHAECGLCHEVVTIMAEALGRSTGAVPIWVAADGRFAKNCRRCESRHTSATRVVATALQTRFNPDCPLAIFREFESS
jgi:hypothetical protein